MIPKARTDELADAALRVVERSGVAGLSYRTVAEEAGYPLGTVQRSFATKTDLLAATIERSRVMISAGIAGEPGRPTLSGWLTEMVMATLPVDDARRAACLVATSFGERAPFEPAVAQQVRGYDEELRRSLAGLVRRAQSEGEVSTEVDADVVARNVLAYAAGLGGQLLYDAVDEAGARVLVEQAVRGIVG